MPPCVKISPSLVIYPPQRRKDIAALRLCCYCYIYIALACFCRVRLAYLYVQWIWIWHLFDLTMPYMLHVTSCFLFLVIIRKYALQHFKVSADILLWIIATLKASCCVCQALTGMWLFVSEVLARLACIFRAWCFTMAVESRIVECTPAKPNFISENASFMYRRTLFCCLLMWY